MREKEKKLKMFLVEEKNNKRNRIMNYIIFKLKLFSSTLFS